MAEHDEPTYADLLDRIHDLEQSLETFDAIQRAGWDGGRFESDEHHARIYSASGGLVCSWARNVKPVNEVETK